MSSEPGLRMAHHIHATAVPPAPTHIRTRVLRKIIVEIEPTIESRRQALAVENHCPDERCRAITLLFKQLRQGRMSGGQRYRKIGHAVRTWQQSCQDSRVRGVGDRTGSEGLRKAKALFCQAVQGRRLDALIAVAAHMVGAKGIDGYQENVSGCCPFPLRSCSKTGDRSQPGKSHEPNALHASSD